MYVFHSKTISFVFCKEIFIVKKVIINMVYMIQHAQSRLDYCKGTLQWVKVSGKRLWDCNPKVVLTWEDIEAQIAKCLNCHDAIEEAKKRWKLPLAEAHTAKKRVELAIEACNKAL